MSLHEDNIDTQPRLEAPVSFRQIEAKRPFLKFSKNLSKSEKFALLGTGIVWTLAIWAALIIVIVTDGDNMWQWLNTGSTTVQAAPLPEPATIDDWLAKPTLANLPSPTATRVVDVADPVLPATSATPTSVPATATNTPEPQPTDPPAPTVTDSPPDTPVSPTHNQAEVAAVTLPEPTTAAEIIEVAQVGSQDSPAIPATPAPWPPPSAPPEPLTPQQLAAMPSHILINSVGIDTPVVPVGWYTIEQDGQRTSTWEVAEYAAGWHQNSALPGEPGNTVISAHSNISGEVFRYLSDVTTGDQIVVIAGAQAFAYEISETTIVKEAGQPLSVRQENARWIAPTDDERLTLITCWPYPHSTHRLIVVAHPVR